MRRALRQGTLGLLVTLASANAASAQCLRPASPSEALFTTVEVGEEVWAFQRDGTVRIELPSGSARACYQVQRRERASGDVSEPSFEVFIAAPDRPRNVCVVARTVCLDGTRRNVWDVAPLSEGAPRGRMRVRGGEGASCGPGSVLLESPLRSVHVYTDSDFETATWTANGRRVQVRMSGRDYEPPGGGEPLIHGEQEVRLEVRVGSGRFRPLSGWFPQSAFEHGGFTLIWAESDYLYIIWDSDLPSVYRLTERGLTTVAELPTPVSAHPECGPLDCDCQGREAAMYVCSDADDYDACTSTGPGRPEYERVHESCTRATAPFDWLGAASRLHSECDPRRCTTGGRDCAQTVEQCTRRMRAGRR